MAQPPTAAIVVAAIFGGIAVLFFGYKLYKKFWNWRHQENLLPPVREPPTAYYGQTVVGGQAGSSPYSTMGTSTSRASLMTSPGLGPPWYQHRDSQASVVPSERTSPTMTGLDSSLPITPSEAYDPRNFSTMSSSSSTMTLKKSYATSSSLLKSSSASQHSLLSISTGRRESYLPHSPRNRDSIQIVPPQPLGFGLGGLATATDQKTLAFSKTSGIGASDDFGSGLVWGGADQQEQSGRQSVRSNLGEDDRRRYLQQGPSQTQRSNSPAYSSSPSTSSAAEPPSSLRPHPANPGPATPEIDQNAILQAQSPLQRVGYRPPTSGSSPGEGSRSRRPSEVASLGTDNGESPILAAFRPGGTPNSRSPAQGSTRSALRPSPPPTGTSSPSD